MNFEELLDAELWNSIESNFKTGKYTNAIIDSMLFLSNFLREKTDLEDDGVKLVNNAFSKKDPKIKINKLETETDINIQEGIANTLRGLYQLIRNPRHHDKIEDNQSDAIQIILFINYILSVLKKSKSKFELTDYKSLVFDKEFVEDEKYTDLIVSRIPKRKLYDVLIEIYREKENGDIYHIKRFFSSYFKLLNDADIINYLQIVSFDLLNTNDDNERKYILKSFPDKHWVDIDEIAKLRTENRILKSIKDGKHYKNKNVSDGWLATWCTHLFKHFSLKTKLIYLINEKLESNDIPQIKYCIKHLIPHVWDILDNEQLELLSNAENDPFSFSFYYWFLITIKNEIKKGNQLFYNIIIDNDFIIPVIVKEYFKDALDNFKVDENIKLFSDDDTIEDPFF